MISQQAPSTARQHPGLWLDKSPADPSAADLRDAYALIEAQRRRIEELEQLATKDELTGLANRRGLLSAISMENDRIGRGQSPGGMLVMIDLNDFKAINDTFGHEAGDTALCAVAATLLGFIRTTDIAARVGGDEFVLLLTHTAASVLNRRLQMLDEYLNSLSIDWRGRTLSLKAAIGTKALTGSGLPSQLLEEADSAMYESKLAAKRRQKRSLAPKQRFTPVVASSSTISERITA